MVFVKLLVVRLLVFGCVWFGLGGVCAYVVAIWLLCTPFGVGFAY